jgi:hypothetical protein
MNSVPLIKVPLAFVVITSDIYVFIFSMSQLYVCIYIAPVQKDIFH